jgi:peptidoglycan/LPS O-acetylase OafA/YrhL
MANDLRGQGQGKEVVKSFSEDSTRHISALDGWRGISIVLVLAAHMLPIGPKSWELNVATGVLGMVIFFVLSGFLITSILLTKVSVSEFVTRRFFRVIPLAWLYFAIALSLTDASPAIWWAHFLFYANLPPQDLLPITAHMWSLCVEMQFYVCIAIWYALVGARGLSFLPVVALGFTALRAWNNVYATSITYDRIDEILAGCILALVYHGQLGSKMLQLVKRTPQLLVASLLLLSCLDFERFYLLRPYFAALLVGTTILNPHTKAVRWLGAPPLVFLAGISYALYVIHPMLMYSWLGSGDLIEKYAKRPLLFCALLVLAYLSTNFYERRWIAFGKTISQRFKHVFG